MFNKSELAVKLFATENELDRFDLLTDIAFAAEKFPEQLKTEENRQAAISRVRNFMQENLAARYGAEGGEVIESPIKGTHGNTEYLWHVELRKP